MQHCVFATHCKSGQAKPQTGRISASSRALTPLSLHALHSSKFLSSLQLNAEKTRHCLVHSVLFHAFVAIPLLNSHIVAVCLLFYPLSHFLTFLLLFAPQLNAEKTRDDIIHLLHSLCEESMESVRALVVPALAPLAPATTHIEFKEAFCALIDAITEDDSGKVKQELGKSLPAIAAALGE